jgi:hypothetical protein
VAVVEQQCHHPCVGSRSLRAGDLDPVGSAAGRHRHDGQRRYDDAWEARTTHRPTMTQVSSRRSGPEVNPRSGNRQVNRSTRRRRPRRQPPRRSPARC